MRPTVVLILVFYSAKKKQPVSFEFLLVSHIVELGLNHFESRIKVIFNTSIMYDNIEVLPL